MDNCIFTAHCTEELCDKSCPVLAEVSYLLERNDINMNNPVFQSSAKDIANAQKHLHRDSKLLTVTIDDTSDSIDVSNLFTYVAICENWQGSRLNCSVYHLKLSKHLDAIQNSWSVKNSPENLEYQQIWINKAKILIISHLDYIHFKDFQSQTLLNIIHNRMDNNLKTIVITPPPKELGHQDSVFFTKLQNLLDKVVSRWP